MNVQTEVLDETIVIALKKASREGYPEVAEHLLRALEAMDRAGQKARRAGCNAALMEAYEHIASERTI